MKRGSIGVAALGGTAAAGWFGTGLHPVWWAMWVAPVFVLLASVRLSRAGAFATAAAAWALAGLNMWNYYRGAIEIPFGVAVALVLLPALVFGAAVALWRAFALRGSAWRATLSAPAVWTAYEFGMARFSPHSTFGSLGYTQMDCLPVLQVASIGGIGGVAFVILLFSSSVAAAARVERGRTKLAACATGLLALAFGWGWLRTATASNAITVPVGLVASDAQENRFSEAARMPSAAARYAEPAARLAHAGARAIVLPEKLGRVTEDTSTLVDRPFEAVAENGAILVAGFERWMHGKRYNEARVYGWPGTVLNSYDKHHMIPGFESDLTPGKTRVVLAEPSGKWGVEICKDMDFPQLSRDYARDGVGLILVPAWDFKVDGWLHSRMAIARGVESGFSVARSAKQGLLTVSDSRGRILAESTSSAAPFATLQAHVPVMHVSTVYARFGDWFGWANLALLTLLVASGRRKMSV